LDNYGIKNGRPPLQIQLISIPLASFDNVRTFSSFDKLRAFSSIGAGDFLYELLDIFVNLNNGQDSL